MFTLGRDVDVHYPTNRLILILTGITALISFFINREILTSIQIAGTIFLTWAFGRELDPKREYGAFVGVLFALYSFFIPFNIFFMELLFIILLLRIINTTAGQLPTLTDAGVTLAIAGYLSYQSENWIYLYIYLMGIFLSNIFEEDSFFHIVTAVFGIGSTGFLIYQLFSKAAFNSPILSTTSLLLLLLAYSIFVYLDRDQKIYDDQQNRVETKKILKAQLFFVVTVLLLVFLASPAIGNMIVYSSLMAGLTLYGILSKIIYRIKD